MIWSYILKALTIIVMSLAKFTFVPFVAMGFGFSWGEIFSYTSIGGIIGLVFFVNFSQILMRVWKRAFPSNKKFSTKKARKYLIRWKKYGLLGVSFLSPILITIPVGTFLAIRFGTPQRKIYLAMIGSIIFWSATLSTLARMGIKLTGL